MAKTRSITVGILGLLIAAGGSTLLEPSTAAPLPGPDSVAVTKTAPKMITAFIHADGIGKEYQVEPGTVSEVLASAGIEVSLTDQVSADKDSRVVDNQLIKVHRVAISTSNKNVAIPHESRKQDAEVECDADEKTRVVTPGKDGVRVESWSSAVVAGSDQEPVMLSSVVETEPVTEVVADCAPPPPPPAPEPEPEPAPEPEEERAESKPASAPAPAPAPAARTGTKFDWMRAAGIPESDWDNVDWLVNRESSWNPNAVNPSSGACGLAQSLPCSKVGANWNDPVVSLTWQYNYVKQRYGGYAGAVAHSRTHGWY